MAHNYERITLHRPDGISLVGDFWRSDASDSWAVLGIHGFGGHRGGEKMAALQAACAWRGWSCAAFDFHAHGESGGSMRDLRASGLQTDLLLIAEFLRDRGIEHLGVVGSSMGAFAGAWFATRCPMVAACVFLAPAFRFLERRLESLSEADPELLQQGILRIHSPWLTADLDLAILEERSAFDPRLLAERYRRPALLFHGIADEIIPYQDSITWIQETRETNLELRLLKGGDHRLTAFKEMLAVEACRFFEPFFAGRSDSM